MSTVALPCSPEVERSVLGAMMLGQAPAAHAAETLEPADFSDAKNAALFQILRDLSQEGRQTDVLTVAERARESGALEQIGGEQALLSLSVETVTAASIREHCEIVRKHSVKRKQVVVAQRLMAAALSPADPEEGRREAEAALSAASLRVHGAGGLTPIREVLVESLKTIEKRAKGDLKGLSTGIQCIDRHMGGLQPEDLIVLAGRPANGKTSLAAQIGIYNAEQGKTCAFFECEMSERAVIDRALYAAAGVNQQQFRRDGYPMARAPKLSEAAAKLAKIPFFIDGQAGITPSQIASRCRALLRDHGKLDLICVDNIQRMGSDTRNKDFRQRAAEASAALKELAKEFKVPIIAVSHVRRLQNGEGSDPTLADLQESGNIEQDADIVMFLNNLGLHKDLPMEEEGKVKLIFAKYREGETGFTELFFDKNLTTFHDWDLRPSYISKFGG